MRNDDVVCTDGPSLVSTLSWWALLFVCAASVAVFLVAVSVLSYKLRQLERVARQFDARVARLEAWHGDLVRLDGAARQAAAWGAEVLGNVANGVPPDEAVRRSSGATASVGRRLGRLARE